MKTLNKYFSDNPLLYAVIRPGRIERLAQVNGGALVEQDQHTEDGHRAVARLAQQADFLFFWSGKRVDLDTFDFKPGCVRVD